MANYPKKVYEPEPYWWSPKYHWRGAPCQAARSRRTARSILANYETGGAVETSDRSGVAAGISTHFMEDRMMVASSLAQLEAVFSQISDPRDARGVRHPFSGIVSLVFLGLLGRITEMAVVEGWAKVNWEELKEPLGFTRDKPPCDTTISRALAGLSLDEFRKAFALWLNTALADQEGRWVAAVDGKTCRQGLDADGSPVQMLNVFLQRVKLTLDQWSIGGDKTNEPGSLKKHLSELLTAYPALQLLTGDAIYGHRRLRTEISMRQVLELIGFEPRSSHRGDQFRGPCPFPACQETADRTFSVHLRRGIFHCFA